MKYSRTLNTFMTDYHAVTDTQKAEAVNDLSIDERFDLLRNIEESPSQYSSTVKSAVTAAFNRNGIYLI